MKLAIITVAALLLAIGSSFVRADDSVVFSDDFSTFDPAWGNADDLQSVSNNKMIIHPPVNRSHLLLYQGNLFGDADIRVKVTQTQGELGMDGGICFWGADYGNFYCASILSNGSFDIVRMMNDRWLTPVPVQKSDAIKQGLGQTNELRVVTQGNLATFFINGQQVIALRGFPPAGGSQLGMKGSSSAQVSTWEFSDFKVLQPPAATSPPPSASDSGLLFSDDFATFDPTWGRGSSYERYMKVEGNKLILRPAVSTTLVTLYNGSLFEDFDLRVSVTQANGNPNQAAGLAFWGSDYADFYMAAVQGDGTYSIQRAFNAKWMMPVPWRSSDAIKKGVGQANNLRVVAKHNSATLYVNDQQLVTFKGFPPHGGSFLGLSADSPAEQAYDWQFSSFSVRKPE